MVYDHDLPNRVNIEEKNKKYGVQTQILLITLVGKLLELDNLLYKKSLFFKTKMDLVLYLQKA